MKTTILTISWLLSTAIAQESSSQSIVTLSGSNRRLTSSDVGPTLPSDFDGSTILASRTSNTLLSRSSTIASNATASSTSTSTTETYTQLVGETQTSTIGNSSITGTTTTSAPRPSNTQPCNNYVELCTRRYSNITEVCAHNSPFVRKNNAGSNQEFGVTQQLNDGIRVLQGQAHYVNGTLYYCHTSCDLLNVGTVEDYLREVTTWLASHPFEVITIIFGNYNWRDKNDQGKAIVTSENFVAPVENSGLMNYIYQPPKTAMELSDWPTLGELIISGKRVITFIDYNFNTATVPWMLWEFYNIWETPFSPTNFDVPCTIGRPDGLGKEKARKMMYMANHNLNVEIAIGGMSLLIPNTVELNVTNGLSGPGSLGLMANQCTESWGRPPNFLLVDYYNYGSPINGSVFEVAARANNVTYNRDCCGTQSRASELNRLTATWFALIVTAVVALFV